MMWTTQQTDFQTIHVYPLNDWQEHVLSERCNCNPITKSQPNGKIVVHNAFDGREEFEKEIERLNKMKSKTAP